MGQEHTDERDGANAADDRRALDAHEVIDPHGPCMACGGPGASMHSTPDGPARLCRVCATLEGLGCP
jgi:hypothetical protein